MQINMEIHEKMLKCDAENLVMVFQNEEHRWARLEIETDNELMNVKNLK